ncbi:MAG: hypothetical protein KDK12_18925 [Rhodobacteraceae bacterium]|nr:hypothetical protein [Paracoccaceae bacterium]
MTRPLLALAALLTLTLNGSIAVASVPATCTRVCALPLGMISAPPPRPQETARPQADAAA